jgi:Dolichyl-phosphate-mannose-protein mannosyltransferase
MRAIHKLPVSIGDRGGALLLQRAEAAVERLAPTLAAGLIIAFAIWGWLASREARLQFDELLELDAATAPTTVGVLTSLAAGVDYNPPLSHFVIRYAVKLLGNTETAARLPAFLGVALLLVSLYVFISRELSRLYGVMAMLVILCSPVRQYAVQARPYGLVLGLSGLLLLAYRDAIEKRRRLPALIGIGIIGSGLVAAHYYAILVIGVLLGLEGLRAWESKRPDWPLVLSCALPPLIVVFLLRGLIRTQRMQLAHYFSRGNLLSFDHGFDFLALDPLACCLALALIMGILGTGQARYKAAATSSILGPGAYGLRMGGSLLLLPVLGAVVTQFVTHAYLPRYFLPAAIGFAICFCYAAKLFSGILPGLALLIIVPCTLSFGKAVLQEGQRSREALPPMETLTAARQPILFDTPAAYMQIQHYYPTLRDSVWVIADPSVSLRYRGYDTDDRIMLAIARQGRAQVTTLSAAVRRWPHFSLVPRSADSVWALQCLISAAAPARVGATFGNSNYLFDVSVPPEALGRIDACASSVP